MSSFSSAEYSALQAKYTERDNRVYDDQKKVAESFLDPAVESGLGRAPTPGQDWFEEGEKMVRSNSLVARRIFQIKKYDHLSFGNLYRVYTSGTLRSSTGHLKYAANF